MTGSLYQTLVDWTGNNVWIAQVFVVVFLTLLLSLMLRMLAARLHRKLQQTENPWDDAFVSALQKPLALLTWIVGIAFAADIVRLETEAAIFNAVAPVRDIGVIASITWFLLRLVSNVQHDAAERSAVREDREDRIDATTVEAIGWRLTRIRTFDKRPIYIPNGIFSTIAVINPSRMSHRRIKETIGLRYDDVEKVPLIIEDIRSMLKNHPEIDTSQTLMVNFNSFSASSLDFFIYTFTHTTLWTRYHEIKQDVLLKISEIITMRGAEIAYPTSTLHLPELEQVVANAAQPG